MTHLIIVRPLLPQLIRRPQRLHPPRDALRGVPPRIGVVVAREARDVTQYVLDARLARRPPVRAAPIGLLQRPAELRGEDVGDLAVPVETCEMRGERRRVPSVCEVVNQDADGSGEVRLGAGREAEECLRANR